MLLTVLLLAVGVPQEQGPVKVPPAHTKALGVEFAAAESRLRRSMISTRTPYGFLVKSVTKDSAAAKAGWRVGDVVLEWDGQPLSELSTLDAAVRQLPPGTIVKFKLARYKKNLTLLTRQPWEYHEGTLAPKEIKN
jgi:S1-C subfamily serine protease